MSNYIPPDEFVALLQEAFDRGQELTFTPSGKSMLPMLDGVDDKVTLASPPARLAKYDVAFYRRSATGHLVLHRMVGFDRDGGYIFCGDNQRALEYGVTHGDVLAIMSSYTHHGRLHSVRSVRYRLYSRRIVYKRKLRALLSKAYHTIKRS